MAGVRLHHPTLRGCLLVVELEKEWAVRSPRFCPTCEKDHDRKAVHVRLDAEGDTIVSPEVYASLQAVYLAGMELANEIESPPVQLVGAVEQPTLHVVEHRLNADTNAAPAYRKGRTKYESRDRLHRSIRRKLRKAG